ncbi:unnamed protein product [Arctogadus glacialis]
MAQAKDTHKWTPQETRRLINIRATRDNEFLKSKMIARVLRCSIFSFLRLFSTLVFLC